MGDATYQETFNGENQAESQEKIRRKRKALSIRTRRTLAALRTTPAIIKLAKQKIP